MGKTEAATSLVHETGADRQVRAWFTASSTEELIRGYADWLVFMKVVSRELVRDMSPTEILNQVKQKLSEYPTFLVVLDNADDPEQIIDWVPQLADQKGALQRHVLITSRSNQWTRLTDSFVSANCPPPEVALQILRLHCGVKQFSESEQKAAQELICMVDCFPLALGHFGAHFRQQQPSSLSQLVQEWRQNMGKVMNRNDLRGAAKTIWGSLDTLLQTVRTKPCADLAEEVLQICSLLHADRITKDFLLNVTESLVTDLSQWERAQQRDEAFAILTAYSLLKFDPEANIYSIHRLVQDTVRMYYKPSTFEPLIPVLVGALESWFWLEEDNPLQIQNRQADVALHLQTLLALSNVPFSKVDEAHIRLLQAEYLYFFFEKAEESRKLAEQTMEVFESSQTLVYARLLFLLGRTLGSVGRHAEQREKLEKCLQIRINILADDHRLVAKTRNFLGDCLCSLRLYKDAVHVLNQALQVENQPRFQRASILGSLGVAYLNLGLNPEAEQVLTEALSIKKALYGVDHVEVGKTLRNCGNIHKVQGRYEEAKRALETSLVIMEKTYGTTHQQVAITLTNLGNLYEAMGSLKEADRVLRRALSIKEDVFGKQHGQVALTLDVLGSLYLDLGRNEEAVKALKRSLDIKRTEIKDESHWAGTLSNLGRVLEAKGDLPEAESALQDSVAIKSRVWGDNHSQTAKSRCSLGRVYLRQGKLDLALQTLQLALTCQQLCYPDEDHPELATTLLNMAKVLNLQGDWKRARHLAEKAAGILVNKSAAAKNDLAEAEVEQAKSYEATNELELAKLFLVQAQERYLKSVGPTHPLTRDTASFLQRIQSRLQPH